MSTIIKLSKEASAGAAAPRAFQFDDVGQAYLHRVRGEAAKLVAAARKEAAQIKNKALEEGKQAAIQAVEASLRTRLDQQLTNALSAVRQAASEITKSRHTWQQHWEQHVVTLAASIAARLCRRELNSTPEITLQWIHEALELAAGCGELTLRLHSSDHAALSEQVAKICRSLAELGKVQIVADDSITPGGCRVDTQFGSLDQQLEAQISRITEELLS